MENIDKERYEHLIQARNFHYTNFNIWMVFFTVIVGAIFAGYCGLLTNEVAHDMIFEQNVLLIAGYLASLFWHWSCKGYYYWIISYMKLLCDCERDIDDKKRVYSCIANKSKDNHYFNITKGANISTSVMVSILSYFVAVVWAIIILYKLLSRVLAFIECEKTDILVYKAIYFAFSLIFSLAFTALLSLVVKKCKCLHSNIDEHKDLEL